MNDALTIACHRCGTSACFEDVDRGQQIYCDSCGCSIDIPEVETVSEHDAIPEPETIPDVESAGSDVSASSAADNSTAETITAETITAETITAETVTTETVVTLPRTAIEGFRWNYPQFPFDASGRQWLRNSPAVDAHGRVLACVQQELVALLPENGGEVAWSYATGGLIPGSPSIGPDGHVRVHSGDGLLHCIDGDGRAVWKPVAVGEPLGWASPVIDAHGNTWICAYGGGLIRVDSAGGTEKRPFFRSSTKFDCTPIIVDDILYVGSEDKYVFALSLTGKKGQSLWNQDEHQGETGRFINSAIAVTEERLLIVVSRDDCLYGLRLGGELAWKMELSAQTFGSPVVDNHGQVFLGVGRSNGEPPGRGSLLCIDIRTQTVRWRYDIASPIESTPVIGNDSIVYFGDNAGAIHAVDRAGRAVWVRQVGVPIRSAGSILPCGQVVFGLDDGSLLALECSSTGTAGGWPKYMGSLSQSGRACAAPG